MSNKENRAKLLFYVLLILLIALSISSSAMASYSVYQGRISGSFRGYKDGNVYELGNGIYWIQMDKHSEYVHSYNPEAEITQDYKRSFLSVKGTDKAVQVIPVIMVSRIIGRFDGWNDSTIFELDNGSIWKKMYDRYYFGHGYDTYRPKVYIAEYDRETLALVDGTDVLVPVERIR